MSVKQKLKQIIEACTGQLILNDSDILPFSQQEYFDIADELERVYDIQINNESLLECKTFSQLNKLVVRLRG